MSDIAQEPTHGAAGASQRRAHTTREQPGLIPDEDFWGRPDKELTQLAEAAEAYVDAKGTQRTIAELHLREAVKALRRARALAQTNTTLSEEPIVDMPHIIP